MKLDNIRATLDKKYADEDKRKIYMANILFFGTAINLSTFLLIGFQTLIPTTILIILIFISCVSGYVFFKKHKIQFPGLNAYAICPLIINLLLTINYVFSVSEHQETYRFKRGYYWNVSAHGAHGEPDVAMSTKIALENNVYQSYWGMRTFLSVDNIGPTERITYTFKRGLFGIRVMTKYKF
jgi:hypothetical protein